MLDGGGGGGEFVPGAGEDRGVGFGVVDLVASALGAGVDAEEGDAGAKAQVEGVAGLFDVGPGLAAEDEAGVRVGGFVDEDVAELGGIDAGAVAALGVRGLRRVGREG